MNPFIAYWLSRPETFVTVLGPAMFFASGWLLRPAWRRMTALHALLAIAAVPACFYLSTWNEKGLRIIPAHVIAYGVLVLCGVVDMRRDWFAFAGGTWLGTLLPDFLGAWAAWGATYRPPHWTWGIGGYGVTDGLFVYPVVFTAMFLLGQLTLHRRWLVPSTWLRRLPAR